MLRKTKSSGTPVLRWSTQTGHMDLYALQVFAGHRDPRTTERSLHARDEQIRRASGTRTLRGKSAPQAQQEWGE